MFIPEFFLCFTHQFPVEVVAVEAPAYELMVEQVVQVVPEVRKVLEVLFRQKAQEVQVTEFYSSSKTNSDFPYH